MNDFVWWIFKELLDEAHFLAQSSKRHVITSREIQTAVRLILPGELSKHAVSEGTKAVTKFSSSILEHTQPKISNTKPMTTTPTTTPTKVSTETTEPLPHEKKHQKRVRVSQSRSARSGLQFPVGRFHRLMREILKERIGAGSPVYLAAVIEYLCAEILELAGNAARDNKRLRIIPRHITLAVKNDEELNTLLLRLIIPEGGVLPNIHYALLPKIKPSSHNNPQTSEVF